VLARQLFKNEQGTTRLVMGGANYKCTNPDNRQKRIRTLEEALR